MKRDPSDLSVILLYNLDRSWPNGDIQEVLTLVHELRNGLTNIGHPIKTICLEDSDLELVMSGCDPAKHIVFNWCEEIPGIPRSAHVVAQKLEDLGFIFTGASSQALKFSQDKPAIKECLFREAIATPVWQVCSEPENLEWNCFPAIVKPAYEHFSYGITHEAVVHNRQELSRQVARIVELFHQPVLVEDFIDGREFHVTVIGNGHVEVFPIAEMDFSEINEDSGRVCTYDSKFSPNSLDYQMIKVRLPAKISSREQLELENTAIAAYRATNCRDYGRMDIREREGTFFVLDVNPNADISPDTSLTLAAEFAGYSFGQLGSKLVSLAAHRHPVFGI